MNSRVLTQRKSSSTSSLSVRKNLLQRKSVYDRTRGPTGWRETFELSRLGERSEQEAGYVANAIHLVRPRAHQTGPRCDFSGLRIHADNRVPPFLGSANPSAYTKLVPLPRTAKTEASFDDDDEGKGELKLEDGATYAGTPRTPTTAPPVSPPPPPPPAAPAAVPPVPSITWNAANMTTVNSGGASTTVEQAFTPAYTATKDTAANVWRMGTTSITGGVDIEIHTGGSRDPTSSPPTTEAEAQEAVTIMKGYYARGSRGKWHTEAASKAHEGHHYREWKCSAEHYWALAGPAIATLTAPLASHADSAAAVAAMKASADPKVTSFKAAARAYWMKLADNASSRPYAAGQDVLNTAVTAVQTLATAKGWTVEQGTTATSGTEPPCYEAWDAYSP
jgi:hypothetical protein